MIDFIIAQVIGAIGYAILSLSYFKKERKQILFLQIIAYLIFAVHYYLLSGITGAICNVLGLIALLVIYLLENHKGKIRNLVTLLIIIVIIAVNIAMFQNIYSIFPLISSVVVIISFLSNNENDIRKIGIVAAVCWLIYAIVYKSYVATAFEIFTLISTIIAFIKNRNKKSGGEKNES